MHDAHCRNLLKSSLGLALLLTSSLALAQPLLPFSASYAADMKKIPVNGEASHSLSANADGSWTLTFNAGMFVARLTEQSTLRLEGDQLLPLSYRYERRGLGRSRVTTQEFDWSQGQIRGRHKDKDFTLQAEPGLLDKTTYQLALQRDLMAGKQEMHYRVVEGDDIDDYHFRVVGEKQVSTQAGRFNTVEVERVREPDAKRQTTLWFAKDYQYLLVRLSQTETDGQHYQIMLEEARINGEPVVGSAN
ncbi:DUF3108 domain-containing protein [Halopseudomonas phragmitis]|uniref:DUF3108 domain-containing protein n=1 Tax=Halopseudomonas phragmitis TaxID=1931241 RepID=A0A1V0B541_9GAMM|nr:DUF3108 domain-containing protein [Halopseudomonas phragmitis]AQZ95043.1 hypothetical protein BVH74_09890 [Halopseudomonas phragmitis]